MQSASAREGPACLGPGGAIAPPVSNGEALFAADRQPKCPNSQVMVKSTGDFAPQRDRARATIFEIAALHPVLLENEFTRPIITSTYESEY